MIYLRRKRPRATPGPVYARARHRIVDAAYAAALAEVGDICRAEDGARLRAPRPGAAQSDPVPAPNVVVLTLHGELDVSKKQAIENELGLIERFEPAAVTILDLSDVQYLDTTFLNALLRTQQRVRNTGHCIRIVAPRPGFISRIFTLTNLDKRFDIFNSVLSAQRYVSGSGPSTDTAPTS